MCYVCTCVCAYACVAVGTYTDELDFPVKVGAQEHVYKPGALMLFRCVVLSTWWEAGVNPLFFVLFGLCNCGR